MTYFISSDSTFKHRAAEAFIEDSFEKLENPDVARALGHHAEILLTLAHSLYIPDIRHGHVMFPDSPEAQQGIPLIVMSSIEEYALDPRFNRIPENVRGRLATYFEDKPGVNVSSRLTYSLDQIEATLQTNTATDTITLDEESAAMLTWFQNSAVVDIDDTEVQIPYITAPVMLVHPMHASNMHSGVIAIHELDHANQLNTGPVDVGLLNEAEFKSVKAAGEVTSYTSEWLAIHALSPYDSAASNAIYYNTRGAFMGQVLQENPNNTAEELLKKLTEAELAARHKVAV